MALLGTRHEALTCHPVYRRNPKEKKEVKEPKEPDTAQKQQSTLKVTDQYIALLIRVFVAGGLLDVSSSLGILGPIQMKGAIHQALSSMCEECIIGTNLSRKATLLVAEVLHMANKVLSLSAAAKIQVCEPLHGSHRVLLPLSNYMFSSHRWFHVYSP